MKNILLGLALLSITTLAKAQAPTTQEEYNYATKGLKMQRGNGTDMKAGYSVVNSSTTTAGTYTVVVEDLLRKADNSLACTIIEVNNSTWANKPGPTYFCMPNPKAPQEMKNQYWLAIQALSSIDIHRAINYGLASRVVDMTNSYYGKK